MSEDKKPKIVACIPAYNEEKYIAKVILQAKPYVDEIIVCNDGSTDMTEEIAKALGAIVINHEKNMGYGAALRTLFIEARRRDADVMVTLDADAQHDPSEISQLLEPILDGEADIVIGSRFLGETDQPFWRRFGIKSITWLARKTYRMDNLTDAQSGYRAYSRRALQLITPEDRDMGASIDIIYQAKKHNLRIVEKPIQILYHDEASTQNPVIHASKIITRILQLITEENPLKYLGLPGIILAIIGIFSATYLIWVFNQTRYFSIPIALITIGALFMGTMLFITALILYTITRLMKKM